MSLIEKAVERLEGFQQTPVRGTGAVQIAAPVPGVEDKASLDSLKPGKAMSKRIDLDLEKLGTAGFITPDSSGALIAEEFRVIKRPLIGNTTSAAAPIRNANLIMVTSSLPGEGKSFTALNLALSIALEMDRTVLLVDADVARPSLPRLLGIQAQKGLLDILQDKSLDMSDVMLRTNIDKLSILTAGTANIHATELLASESMGRLLNEIAKRYSDRIVIFDSPPLLVTTEARVLATRLGQIVFVVRAEETPQNAVKEALSTIEACPVKLVVLNQARSVENAAYGYQYGYGY